MPSTHLSSEYRADIDGLRAVAVILVILFHAFPSWLPGGFIGVDIFFVISGYLISTIIISGLESNKFSFLHFYIRRIKRIFPALILVLTFCIVLGWLILFANEYKQLGKHIAGGAGFVSNLILWNESGYFDNSGETKPLLHLWSLGVEEQFYILWPLLMWCACKRRLNLLTIAVTILIISFSLNIRNVSVDAIAAFYSPQTRFWELMVGSVYAYIAQHRQVFASIVKIRFDKCLGQIIYAQAPEVNGDTLRNFQSLVAFALIAFSAFAITKDQVFPGWLALMPTLGAMLIISAGPKAWLNRTVLSHKLLVWLGLISFPLYLWHWPLLSFARIVTGEIPSQKVRFICIFISIIFAWLTYVLFEKTIRFGRSSNVKVIVLVALMAIVFTIGISIYHRNGLEFRSMSVQPSGFGGGWDGLVKECNNLTPEQNRMFFCRQDLDGEPKFAVLGDSKAGALAPGLFRTSNKAGRWLLITSGSSALIPVLSDVERLYRHSPKASVEAAIDFINKEKNIKIVLIAVSTRALFGLNNDFSIEDLPSNKNYDVAFEGLNNTVNKFTNSGKRVVLLIDNPTLAHKEDCLSRIVNSELINQFFLNKNNHGCSITIEKYRELSKQYSNLLYQIQINHPDMVEVFDATNTLCDFKNKSCSHIKDGHLMYGTSDHISDYASGLIGGYLNERFAHFE